MTTILIVKMSSMGDIIQTLPAINDAAKVLPNLAIDWVVEEAFVEIPQWHPAVKEVIPIAFRRFRKQPMHMISSGELRRFLTLLRQKQYDYIIDAQGLIKSAIVTRLARGFRCGLDRKSAWEPIASLVYRKKVTVDPKQHAIQRMRTLFSAILGYPEVNSSPEYGLKLREAVKTQSGQYLLFIHGTTWNTKEWPEEYWVELSNIATANNFVVLLPWGNLREHERAKRIANNNTNVTVLPKTNLSDLAGILSSAVGVVCVDTGLGHLAAAFNIPTVSLYGATDPKEIGTTGRNVKHIAVNFECAPCWSQRCGYNQRAETFPACYSSIKPQSVWQELMKIVKA